MNFKRFTNTPYLVLFILLISVGVGTASALVTITLAGNVHITGDTTTEGIIQVGTGGSTSTPSLTLSTENENTSIQSSFAKLEINKNGNDVLLVENPDANVGIGTSDPFAKLHVQGDILTDGSIHCIGNNGICFDGGQMVDETIAASKNKQPQEVTAITVGLPTGSIFNIVCPPGSIAIGMNVRAGALIDDIQLRCKEIVRSSLGPHIGPVLGGGIMTSDWATGSNGGALFTFDCAPEFISVMQSMKFWENNGDSTLEGMDVGCINLADGSLSNSPGEYGTSTGFTAGFASCTTGRVITGISGFQDGLVRQMGPYCG